MADPKNFAKILSCGLMSTEALVDLFEVTGEERVALLSSHRPDSVRISHPSHGVAIVRDQKPMSLGGLMRSVRDATPEQFLEFINRRTFFWPTKARLSRMNGARAYRHDPHVVFVVRTESIVQRHRARILLSPMNSGATTPVPHDRSVAMFKSIELFDFDGMKRNKLERIGELTVEGGVPDLLDHVLRVEVWAAGQAVRTLSDPYDPSEFA